MHSNRLPVFAGRPCATSHCPHLLSASPIASQGLRLWMEDSKPPRGTVTFGIQTFLQSKLGAWILNFVTGSRSLNGAIRNA
eukprot:scaffold63404_cov35-Tisochrysis_lutea.AAC.2